MKQDKPRDFTDMVAALKPLGFEHKGNGFFYHDLTSKCFNFSTNSLEGIVSNIYYNGQIDGKQALRKSVKDFWQDFMEEV
jgi:hypothetical protein